MRIAVAAALSIVFGASLARAQETPQSTSPDPNHRTSEERAAEVGKSDDLGRVWYVDARDSLRKPIPSL